MGCMKRDQLNENLISKISILIFKSCECFFFSFVYIQIFSQRGCIKYIKTFDTFNAKHQ